MDPSSSTFYIHQRDESTSSRNGCIHATSPVIQRSGTVYHPVASLMLNSNTLRDCYQISDFYTQCLQNRSIVGGGEEEPFICGVAEKYHAICQNNEKS
jgi:hypothetical protein